MRFFVPDKFNASYFELEKMKKKNSYLTVHRREAAGTEGDEEQDKTTLK